MNFFTNIKNNAYNLKKSYVTVNTKYDASIYIKGRAILNMSVEEIFSPNYRAAPLIFLFLIIIVIFNLFIQIFLSSFFFNLSYFFFNLSFFFFR